MVIDSDYCGIIMVPLHNFSRNKAHLVKKGDWIVQMLIERCYKIYWDHNENLQETEPTARGSGGGGFGSTGCWKKRKKKPADSRKKSEKKNNKMNNKSQVPSFDSELHHFEPQWKCSHCPNSRLLNNIHFLLFFCKTCRTYLSREERLNVCVSTC